MEHLLPPGREAPIQIQYVKKPRKFRAAFSDLVEYTDSLSVSFELMGNECKADPDTNPFRVFQDHFSRHRTHWATYLRQKHPTMALHECMASSGDWREDIGLLQEWMFFALLGYFMQGSVERDDFLVRRDDGSTVYNTSALNDYLVAWKDKNTALQEHGGSPDGTVSQAVNAPQRSAVPAAVQEDVQSVPIYLDRSEENDPTVIDSNDDHPVATLEQTGLSGWGANSENPNFGKRSTASGTFTDDEEGATSGTFGWQPHHAASNAPNDNVRRAASNGIEPVWNENYRSLSAVSDYSKQCHVFSDRGIDSRSDGDVAQLRSFSEALGPTQMLGAVLYDAFCYVAFPPSRWNPSIARLNTTPTVDRQISASTYCPRFRSTFLTEVEPLGWALYVFSLGTMRKQLDHARCTARVCRASNAASGQSLQHTRPGCGCAIVEVLHQETASISRRGIIPLIRLQPRDDGQICFDIVELNGDEPYIALSHVWVDGLGDQNQNTIASCQLRRIMEGSTLLVKTFTSSSSALPAFWLDALCIPAGSKTEEYQRFRDFSISQMHRIYAEASATSILDPDLWCSPGSATATEIMIKFVISVHAARLWTFQETTLCPIVYALGRDCIHDLKGLKSRLERESIFCRVANNAYFWHERLFGLDGTGTAQVLDPNHILPAIQRRASSRPDDECICLATLMRVDTDRLTAAGPAGRMAISLWSMSSIPIAALFAHGPRLDIPGLRWAPKSFLKALGGGIGNVFDLSRASRYTAHLASNDQGLCLDSPAIKLGPIGWRSSDGLFHVALESAMSEFRSWGHSEPWVKTAQRALSEILRGRHKVRNSRYSSGQYGVEAYDSPSAGPETELAVLVLSNPAHSGKAELGVLVESRYAQSLSESSCTPREDAVACGWRDIVMIWAAAESEQHKYTNVVHDLKAEWIPSQRWLVDGPSGVNQPMAPTEDSGVNQKRLYDHGDSSPHTSDKKPKLANLHDCQATP